MSDTYAEELDARAYAHLVPQPKEDANKYSHGTVGVIGGSASYPGAPILASMAAARSGAGYVRLVTPAGAASCAHAHLLSIPVTACPQSEVGTFCSESLPSALDALAKSDVILVGPGLGTTSGARDFLAGMPQDRPLVLDADALNIIAHDDRLLTVPARAPRVLTPHEGEAARLLGRPVANRLADALHLASTFDATVLLKGPQTLVVTPQGAARAISEGGPELAKAGSGDVLSGIIAAFLAQGLQPIDAASLAAYIHGRAGKLSAIELGVHAVMPEDIISKIGPALLSLEA